MYIRKEIIHLIVFILLLAIYAQLLFESGGYYDYKDLLGASFQESLHNSRACNASDFIFVSCYTPPRNLIRHRYLYYLARCFDLTPKQAVRVLFFVFYISLGHYHYAAQT